jgi:hypothetical protein
MRFPSRRLLLACAAAAASVLPRGRSNAANMQTNPARPNIVGTWKLVGVIARDSDGKELPKPFGPKGMGIITLNADGRMMVVLCDGRPALPEGTVREYGSYRGNYTFDGQTLVTRVDASSNAKLIGGDQERKVRFEGKRIVLIPPPVLINGVTQLGELYWERISSMPA